MSYAVKTPPLRSIYFLMDLPEDREGLEIEDGAWVDIPPNVHAWPPGTNAPEQVLCRLRQDPKHYKLFKYRDEIDGADWEDTGMNLGGTFSASSWGRFARGLGSLKALHAIPDAEGP